MTLYRAMFGRINRGCPSYQFPKFECVDESDDALTALAVEALRIQLNVSSVCDWDLITVERVKLSV